MPPETTAPKTDSKTPAAPAVDYSTFIGKYFASPNQTGLNHGAIFRVIAFEPKFKFAAAIGVKPAFKLARVSPPGCHWEQSDEFLKTHKEVEYVE